MFLGWPHGDDTAHTSLFHKKSSVQCDAPWWCSFSHMLHSFSPVTQVILPLPYVFLQHNNNLFIPFGLGHQAPQERYQQGSSPGPISGEAPVTKLQPEAESSLFSELTDKQRSGGIMLTPRLWYKGPQTTSHFYGNKGPSVNCICITPQEPWISQIKSSLKSKHKVEFKLTSHLLHHK